MAACGWTEASDVSGFSLNKREIEINLEKIVVYLSERIGVRNYERYQNLNLSADYIADQFVKMGLDVEVMSYWFKDKEYRNIVAEKPSKNKEKGIVIVGAHYDSCFNPGADDNASGVAGMLELARLLKKVETKKRIRFIAFTNEEPPFFKTDFMGSFVCASQMKKNEEKIEIAIILESIGFYSEERNSQGYPFPLGLFYPNKGNFIGVVSNFPSWKIAKKIATSFKNNAKLPMEFIAAPAGVSGIDFSDHASFWKNGYSAVMVTDTAFLRNKNYHQQTDLPGTLNYGKMAEVVWGLKEAVADFVR